jgi:hypothetical protein
VLVTSLVGEVTTITEDDGAINTDLWSNPTVGADVALCTALDIANNAVGTMYFLTGTVSDALLSATSGAFTNQPNSFVVSAGTIDLKTGASKTGATKWVLQYIPLDPGASVVVA